MSDAMFWAVAIMGASFFMFLSICVLAIAWASKREERLMKELADLLGCTVKEDK